MRACRYKVSMFSELKPGHCFMFRQGGPVYLKISTGQIVEVATGEVIEPYLNWFKKRVMHLKIECYYSSKK